MPTVTLNKKILEGLVGKKLSLEELKDRISMLGTNLEKIENEEIQVEIFPNRPDLLSEQGFARALSSFIGVKTGLIEYKVKESGEKVIIDDSVRDIRPFTTCAIVKGLSFNGEKIREVIQIQEKLHLTYGRNRKKVAMGVYPLEKIRFPITYKADLPERIKFRPLDAEREMTAREILTEHKTGQEFAHLLEGKEKYPFFIDSAGEILSMPPIINSDNTGRITSKTNDIFVECSGFDFAALSTCLNIIVTTLSEMGGKIYSINLEAGREVKKTPDLNPTEMELDLKYINKRLGLNLAKKEAVELLARMGFGFNGKVLIPAYRTDILHQVDLMEDLAIAYGYENFEEEMPKAATIGEENRSSILFRKVREILIGLRLIEVKNYHLMMQEELLERMNRNDAAIPLKNTLGEHNHLRNSILPSLMKNLRENQHNEYPQNLFEIGRTFAPDSESETGIRERELLGIVLCHDKTDFTEIRQVLEALFSSLGLEVKINEENHPSFITGRVGRIIVGEEEVGILGEIHPAVIENWELMMPVVGLEIDWSKVFQSI